jgi:molecular chaperone GrpE (heat shock protein)
MKSNQPISQYETEIEILDAKPEQKLRLYLMLDIANNLRWMNTHLGQVTKLENRTIKGSEETGVGASDSPMQNKEVAESISNILDQVENFNSDMDDIRREIEDNDHEHDQYALNDDFTDLQDTIDKMKESFTNPKSVEISWS